MSKENKTYFISGGGTGGHIYPAVAVVKNLLNQPDTGKIYFIGNPKNMEYDIVKNIEKVEFLPVNVSGMPRKFGFGFLGWLCQLEFALWKALYYFQKYKPDAVFTTGGYVSAPAAFTAGLLKKPLMIHDCDSVPGLVSKAAAPFADVISVAFESAKNILKSNNICVLGNPVRTDSAAVSKEEAREKLGLKQGKFTILVTGGSQGAKTLNDAAVYAAQHIVEKMDTQLIIQTGRKKYDEVIKQFKEYFPHYSENTNLLIRPYFDDMFLPLKAADVAVSRAGSLTLSELNLCGLPCILVPYPHAAADHQRKNAMEAEKAGYALWCDDADFDGEKFIEMIYRRTADSNRLTEMSKASNANAKPLATDEIVKKLKSIVK